MYVCMRKMFHKSKLNERPKTRHKLVFYFPASIKNFKMDHFGKLQKTTPRKYVKNLDGFDKDVLKMKCFEIQCFDRNGHKIHRFNTNKELIDIEKMVNNKLGKTYGSFVMQIKKIEFVLI